MKIIHSSSLEKQQSESKDCNNKGSNLTCVCIRDREREREENSQHQEPF